MVEVLKRVVFLVLGSCLCLVLLRKKRCRNYPAGTRVRVSFEVEAADIAAQSERDSAGLISSNLTSCLMNTGTSFSGNEFSLENRRSRIQVYLNEVTWGR